MDLAKLSAFTVVAEELNFRKSAERLGMSQPPLTRLIASLEEDLGLSLFQRTTRKVSLTAAGLLLFNEARSIFSKLEKIEADVRAVSKIKRGTLEVGFSQTAFLARLPKIIEEFKLRLPGVRFELNQFPRAELIRGLNAGKLDLAFHEGDSEFEGLSRSAVTDEIMGVLVPKTHVFAKRKEIEFRDLKNETLILHPRSENSDHFARISQLCRTAKIEPKTYIKKPHESCPILVATGKGLSLTIAPARDLAFQETRFIPIKSLFLPVSIYWKPENTNPSLKSFLSTTLENQLFKVQTVECLSEIEI